MVAQDTTFADHLAETSHMQSKVLLSEVGLHFDRRSFRSISFPSLYFDLRQNVTQHWSAACHTPFRHQDSALVHPAPA